MLRLAVIAASAAGLAACASHSHGAAQPAGTGPGAVALSYTKALFSGHFAVARRYVAPASRNSLLVITTGLRSSSLSTRNLAVGSTSATGTTAAAILTGTLCSSHGTASAPADCITNGDPHSGNPVFRVNLTRDAAGRWLVTYPVP